MICYIYTAVNDIICYLQPFPNSDQMVLVEFCEKPATTTPGRHSAAWHLGGSWLWNVIASVTSCARGDTICPAPLLPSPVGAQAPRVPPSTSNIAVLSRAEYVPTLTAAAALCVKASLSTVAWLPWPLTFWPWKWCPSHMWRGLSLCQFWSS